MWNMLYVDLYIFTKIVFTKMPNFDKGFIVLLDISLV